MALETLDARDTRQLGAAEHQSRRQHDELRTDLVAAIARYRPPLPVFLPTQLGDPGMEQRILVQVEVTPHPTGVVPDLIGAGVPLRWHVTEVLEQRQIYVGLDVTPRTRIAVPVPHTAEVAGVFDDRDIHLPGFTQQRTSGQTTETASHDQYVDLTRDCVTLDVGLERVPQILRERVQCDVLTRALWTNPLIPLLQITLP